MAVTSRSWTSTTRSSAFLRSRARSFGSDRIALRAARRGRLRIEHDVDASDGAGGDSALQRRTDLGRVGDVLAMSAERRHHPVVAGRRKLRGGALLGAEELDLGKADLAPGGIVPDHHH